MNERERILTKIYKNLAFNRGLNESFSQEWQYIYILFEEHEEDKIPNAVLEFIEDWMDIE